MNIKGLVHVNINCSNFDQSVKFYELLGFQKVFEVPAKNSKGSGSSRRHAALHGQRRFDDRWLQESLKI